MGEDSPTDRGNYLDTMKGKLHKSMKKEKKVSVKIRNRKLDGSTCPSQPPTALLSLFPLSERGVSYPRLDHERCSSPRLKKPL